MRGQLFSWHKTFYEKKVIDTFLKKKLEVFIKLELRLESFKQQRRPVKGRDQDSWLPTFK